MRSAQRPTRRLTRVPTGIVLPARTDWRRTRPRRPALCTRLILPTRQPLDFSDSRMRKPIAADDLIKQYARAPLDFEPRTRWSYSNTGFVLLGRVVEKASGKPFGAFLEERVTRPLGMAHTWFAPPEGKGTIARGYTSFAGSGPEPATREPEQWIHAAGALYASAADLAAWELALVSGKVLRPASYKRMTTRRVLTDGRTTDYGCGIGVSEVRGETVLSHSGEVAGFLAYEAVVPRTRSVVVLLTNADYGDTGALFKTIRDLVLKDGAPETAPPKVAGPRPAEVARALLREMQAGIVDRSKLGEEFSGYLSDARLREAAPRLAALGDPKSVEVERSAERGGMEVSIVRLVFASGTWTANLARSPDGKVQQFLLSR